MNRKMTAWSAMRQARRAPGRRTTCETVEAAYAANSVAA
jgi:hypothetical protein